MNLADQFQNCTPHAIRLLDGHGVIHTIPPCGQVARVEMREEIQYFTIGGVPVITRTPGSVMLPSPEYTNPPEGGESWKKFQIVSSMVLDAMTPGNKYVFAPDTGATAVRLSNGQIDYVTRLVGVRIYEEGEII